MATRIKFLPNQPVTLCLSDPRADAGNFDFGLQMGQYATTDGRTLALPRPAVERLNELDPEPGEEIGICRYDRKNGTRGAEWSVWLTATSEKARAEAEGEPSELTEALQASIEQPKNGKLARDTVTPIRRKPAAKQDDQPRLFDRGTGTDGPAPQLAPAAIATPRTAAAVKTPYGTILRHIIRTVESALKDEGVQLGDAPKQDLYSTVYIDAAKRSGIEYDFTREGK